MPIEVRFVAYGEPKTKGSMVAIQPKAKAGAPPRRPIVIEERKPEKRIWAGLVADAAAEAMAGRELLSGPLEFFAVWTLTRPLKPQFEYPAVRQKDDGDKHLRSVWDALTDVVWDDDGRVVDWHGKKRYVGHPDALPRPGVEVLVRTI